MVAISAQAGVFAKALRAVAPIAERGAISTLANVLIETGDGQIHLTTTGMDKRITRTIAAEVEKPGAFTVDAQRFTSVMSSFDAGQEARVSGAAGFATLICGRSRFKFASLPATDFPAMPFDDPDCSFDADRVFMEALATVQHAFAGEGPQYWLAGAYIGQRDGVAQMAGTDGNRIAVVDVALPDMAETILPAALVDLLLKVEGLPRVELRKDKARFTFGDTVITAKMIDGQFPKFDNFTSIAPPIGIDLDANAVIEALTRIALVADDKDRTVSLTFGQDKLTIANRSPAYEGREEVPCAYAGDPLTLAYRAQFLREAFEAIDADDVRLELTDAFAPTKLTAKSKPSVTMVVMPTR